MSEALRDATARSLVVVDEFGKGTELVSLQLIWIDCLIYIHVYIYIIETKDDPMQLVSLYFNF